MYVYAFLFLCVVFVQANVKIISACPEGHSCHANKLVLHKMCEDKIRSMEREFSSFFTDRSHDYRIDMKCDGKQYGSCHAQIIVRSKMSESELAKWFGVSTLLFTISPEYIYPFTDALKISRKIVNAITPWFTPLSQGIAVYNLCRYAFDRLFFMNDILPSFAQMEQSTIEMRYSCTMDEKENPLSLWKYFKLS